MHGLKNDNERLAKKIARSGFSSRRVAEEYISEGRVKVNGNKVTNLSFKVKHKDKIFIDGRLIPKEEKLRLWKFNKPRGLITSHNDERGRKTVFQVLPTKLPRVVSVGRLDLNSEGLLLLTNDGNFKRKLELPSAKILRSYLVRARGLIDEKKLSRLRIGMMISGINYRPMKVDVIKQNKSNVWLSVGIIEGKNREIRLTFEEIGLQVNRLIRTSFGPVELGNLPKGEVEEIDANIFYQSN